jgi:hypothetical protein
VVVDYTFNEAVTVNETTLPNFFAYLSDGSFVNPIGVFEPSGTAPALVTGSPVVRALYSGATAGTYPLAQGFDEYFVKAGVAGASTTTNLSSGTPATATGGCSGAQAGTPGTSTDTCAVTSATTGNPNTPGSAPIGGNTGGKADGFTTAPDPLNVTFDTQTNTASVTFDQRTYAPATGAPLTSPAGQTSASEAANFLLLDSDGNQIAAATAVSSCSPVTVGFPCPLPGDPTTAAGPGMTTVWLTFPSPAVQVGNGRALEIRGYDGGVTTATGWAAVGGDVFNTDLTGTNATNTPITAAGNVQDIVSPAATAAYKHLRASARWSHMRESSAYLKKVLAKTHHKNKKNKSKK